MEKLINSYKKLILDNYQGELDDRVLDIMSIAVMTLYLKDAKLAEEKLPSILQNIIVYAEDRSVLEIAHDRLNNYQNDEYLKDSKAGVTRCLDVDEEDNSISEKRALLIDTQDFRENTVMIIHNVVHEFTHLYRFGGVENNENEIKVYDGISLSRYNKIKKTLTRKHYQLEEGIVQRYTHQALDLLYEFLDGEKLENDSPLYIFRRNYPSQYDDCYLVQTTLLDYLCNDKEFSDCVDRSFYDIVFPSHVANYYNSVMDSSTSFSFFSRNLDKCYAEICEENEEQAAATMQILNSEINTFRVKSLKRQQKKK